jgi:hypothetical protein
MALSTGRVAGEQKLSSEIDYLTHALIIVPIDWII